MATVDIFSISGTPVASGSLIYPPGDANRDGSTLVNDKTAIERIILGYDPEVPEADVNLDGVINVVDEQDVDKIVLGTYVFQTKRTTVTMEATSIPAGSTINSVNIYPTVYKGPGSTSSYSISHVDTPDLTHLNAGIQLYVDLTRGYNSNISITSIMVRVDYTPPAAPTVVSAATNPTGTVISIVFNKTMADPAGKHGQFKYQVNGGADQSFSAAALYLGTTIQLTCSGTAIAYGNTVTVKYTAGDVQAADYGILASFSGQAVTNNMALLSADQLILIM